MYRFFPVPFDYALLHPINSMKEDFFLVMNEKRGGKSLITNNFPEQIEIYLSRKLNSAKFGS